ncbi:hypothetical protein [Acinetobacter sp. YH01008]|uniref:hypothetical protein n=1 Tax=Acinetobacter sp. YH01008 TaxID=2601024 RepID=UPI0015D30C73|nr:hypothetical protein [Acinetobacter sp. YH01008]
MSCIEKLITLSSLCFIFLASCSLASQTDINSEALKNANRGIVGTLLSDAKVYQIASSSELSPLTQQLLFSTLEKIAVIRGYEQTIGKSYRFDEDLNIAQINQICWMGVFLQKYKQYLPTKIDKNESYIWVDAYVKHWQHDLNESYRDTLIENDCRKSD